MICHKKCPHSASLFFLFQTLPSSASLTVGLRWSTLVSVEFSLFVSSAQIIHFLPSLNRNEDILVFRHISRVSNIHMWSFFSTWHHFFLLSFFLLLASDCLFSICIWAHGQKCVAIVCKHYSHDGTWHIFSPLSSECCTLENSPGTFTLPQQYLVSFCVQILKVSPYVSTKSLIISLHMYIFARRMNLSVSCNQRLSAWTHGKSQQSG